MSYLKYVKRKDKTIQRISFNREYHIQLYLYNEAISIDHYFSYKLAYNKYKEINFGLLRVINISY